MRRYRPDINFWLALAFEAHVHHVRAAAWFDSAPETSCLFCRHTQQGFLRLATNPAVFGVEALSLADSWQGYDALRADSRVGFAAEPHGLERSWRTFTSSAQYSHKVWSDAYLAAFAVAGGVAVVSFDSCFAAYGALDRVQP